MRFACLFLFSLLASAAESPAEYCARIKELQTRNKLEAYQCGILRGPKAEKKIALIVTGGSYAEGYPEFKKALAAVEGKASFFFTGDFLRDPKFSPLVQELRAGGHYIGPHSDKHLEPVDDHGHTKISRAAFHADLQANLRELGRFGVNTEEVQYWIVPSEAYNEEISRWSIEERIRLINYSEGTLSNADYMDDSDPHFISNERILKSILDLESRSGLNGFLLLLHLGAGPGRTKPFSQHLEGLLLELKKRGYHFVRVDELLNPVLEH